MVDAGPARASIEAVWRLEAPRLLGGLVRLVRDLERAEDLAQEALLAALERWPEVGIPTNPGAWLMTVAKNRALDGLRRRGRVERHRELEAARVAFTRAADLAGNAQERAVLQGRAARLVPRTLR
ncbi:MAG: hypothetical protein KC933_33135 [Myxococcales bacterium]|nr:hypothetical protein [Myxococcales bacterium]